MNCKTIIDDLNYPRFKLELFKEKLNAAQEDYNIGVTEGGNPHKRSAKRITILVSEAYLTSDGSTHWVQDLEFEVYRLCKEYYLDCDPLEMEATDRSYVCRDKKSKLHGKKTAATQFDNHMIGTKNFSRQDVALARAIVHYFAHNFYKKEDKINGVTYHPGKGAVRVFRNQQSNPSPTKERKRAALRKPNQNRTGLSGRKIHGVDKPKLHNREELVVIKKLCFGG
jgi:hypothetical protein